MPNQNENPAPESEAGTIRQTRVFFYEFLKSFFVEPPTPVRIAGWREVATALAREAPPSPFREAARRLARVLAAAGAEDLADEYHALFVDPFNPGQLNWNLSYYRDGRNFGPSLVEIRSLMAAGGLVKEDDFKEPEDSLPVLLDLVARLIEGEADAENGPAVARLQGRLRRDFLQPLAEGMQRRLQEPAGIHLYPAVLELIAAWLNLEDEELEPAAAAPLADET